MSGKERIEKPTIGTGRKGVTMPHAAIAIPGVLEMLVIFLVIIPFLILGALITVIPFWKICTKAGFPGALSLLMLVPQSRTSSCPSTSPSPTGPPSGRRRAKWDRCYRRPGSSGGSRRRTIVYSRVTALTRRQKSQRQACACHRTDRQELHQLHPQSAVCQSSRGGRSGLLYCVSDQSPGNGGAAR